jgi:hypothetical protein
MMRMMMMGILWAALTAAVVIALTLLEPWQAG